MAYLPQKPPANITEEVTEALKVHEKYLADLLKAKVDFITETEKLELELLRARTKIELLKGFLTVDTAQPRQLEPAAPAGEPTRRMALGEH